MIAGFRLDVGHPPFVGRNGVSGRRRGKVIRHLIDHTEAHSFKPVSTVAGPTALLNTAISSGTQADSPRSAMVTPMMVWPDR